MNREISIMIADKEYKVFMQRGFFARDADLTDFFHKHSYCEIHIFAEGNAVLAINDREYKLSAGDMVFIPNDTMHYFTNVSKNAVDIPFQLMLSDDMFRIKRLSCFLIEEFLKELEKTKRNDNFTKIQVYLALFCTYLFEEAQLKALKISDYEFIIREYINLNYNKDIRISDLARELHLSEKQTQRLVIKYTGKTFKREIIQRRIDIATHMMNEGRFSLNEISEYLGYQNYSGFWKIFNVKE